MYKQYQNEKLFLIKNTNHNMEEVEQAQTYIQNAMH